MSKTRFFAFLGTLCAAWVCFNTVLKCLTLTLNANQLNFQKTMEKLRAAGLHVIATISASAKLAGKDCLGTNAYEWS